MTAKEIQIRVEPDNQPPIIFPVDALGFLQGSGPVLLHLYLVRIFEGQQIPVAQYAASWPVFESKEQSEAWLERTKELFRAEAQGFILNNLGLLLADCAGRALIEAGIAPYDKQGAVRSHMAIYEKFLRERFNVDVGRPAKWDMHTLTQALYEAMMHLTKSCRTYDKVAEKLQEFYPERAPKNGGSLKKMVKEHGINWMRIKWQIEQRTFEKGS